MKIVLNSREMKACDTYTIQQMQVPSVVLMERAALAVKETVVERYGRGGRVLVLCGSGNNGGDGFAVARLLLLDGIAADVYFAGKEASLTEETALQKKIFENYGGKFCRNPDFGEYTVVVDALLGIGLSRPVTGELAKLIEGANESGKPIVAVDIPSGVSADTGQILGSAIRAGITVTFAFAKRGQLLCPGAEYCGELLVRDIGITAEGFAGNAPCAFTYEKEDLELLLPVRHMRSNKGSYGRALVVGGGENMAGAALLAAFASYRTGCGLVRVLSHEKNRLVLQSGLPEALYLPWQQGEALESSLAWASAVSIGPGLGRSAEAEELLRKALLLWKGPLVLDADALNLLAENADLRRLVQAGAPVIVTPHPGEMSRLTGKSVQEILTWLPETAMEFAKAQGVICVLKDARTVVTDGNRLYINTSGNNGLATGGSGDVLTGILCGLLAQGMAPFEAACLGVYLHGLAGDAAAERVGQRGMTAGDVVAQIAGVLRPED